MQQSPRARQSSEQWQACSSSRASPHRSLVHSQPRAERATAGSLRSHPRHHGKGHAGPGSPQSELRSLAFRDLGVEAECARRSHTQDAFLMIFRSEDKLRSPAELFWKSGSGKDRKSIPATHHVQSVQSARAVCGREPPGRSGQSLGVCWVALGSSFAHSGSARFKHKRQTVLLQTWVPLHPRGRTFYFVLFSFLSF